MVCAEAEPAEDLYLIDSGQAEVVAGGQQRRILRSGDSFGEVAMLRHIPQPQTLRALTPLDVLILPRSDVEALEAPSHHADTTVGRDNHGEGLCRVCGPTAASRPGTA